jgi:hypothetical protein
MGETALLLRTRNMRTAPDPKPSTLGQGELRGRARDGRRPPLLAGPPPPFGQLCFLASGGRRASIGFLCCAPQQGGGSRRSVGVQRLPPPHR